MSPTKFITTTQSIDGATTEREYKTEGRAKARLEEMVGPNAEVDSHGWHIASDGVVKARISKVEVDAPTKRELTKAVKQLAEDADDDEQDELDLDGDEEVEVEDEHRANSVVNATYKRRYAERAEAMVRKPKGIPMKALKRSNTDWLAIELARLTLDDKAHLIVPNLEAILDANGVKHSHWNRTTPGWQGRLRMTGRLALQRVVAEDGELVLADGTTIPAPKAWRAKHAN